MLNDTNNLKNSSSEIVSPRNKYDEKAYKIILGASVGIGIVTNLFAAAVFVRVIKNRKNTILFLHQSVVDFVVCLLRFVVIVYGKPAAENSFTCSIYESEVLYWSYVFISVLNLCYISFERYVAVCHGLKYRKFTRSVYLALILGAHVFTYFAFSLAIIFQMKFENGICEFDVTSGAAMFLSKYLSLNTFVFELLLPVLIFVFCYWNIVLKLKSTATAKMVEKELLVTGIAISVIHVCTMSVNAIAFMLHTFSVIVFVGNALFQGIANYLVALASVMNPFVYYMTMREFKFLLCRDNHVEPESETQEQ